MEQYDLNVRTARDSCVLIRKAARQISTLTLSPVVTICTTRVNIKKFHVLPTQCIFMYFLWISEQTAIISLYSINWSVFITETECLLRGTD